MVPISKIVTAFVDDLKKQSLVAIDTTTFINNAILANLQPAKNELAESYATNIKVSCLPDGDECISLKGTASVECHNLNVKQLAAILEIVNNENFTST